ncbi:MAG TPA: CPBP family intramembrane glutamic endopeptidase [Symbiobacteriaceae bacterium]|nr:CPBP family intramembrane glutamic endopeptidase [Symbiobacteriaceae bacterium]
MMQSDGAPSITRAQAPHMKSFGKLPDLLVAFLVATFVPRLANYAVGFFYQPLGRFDPRGVYLPVSIHHIAQLILTVLICKLYLGTTLSDMGFNLRDRRQSLRIFAWVAVIYTIWALRIFFKDAYLLYPSDATSVAGVLGFQALLSGTAEEPLFRALIIGILASSWSGKVRVGKLEISSPVIIAALFFMYGHMTITFSPFRIQATFLQQLSALVLSLVCGVTLQRTGSLLGPILIHNFTNVVVVGFSMIRAMM